MPTAYERKTPCLPNRICLRNGAGHYHSSGDDLSKDVPDHTCEVIVEYLLSDPEKFHLRTWEGNYFVYRGDSFVDITSHTDSDIPNNPIEFIALDLDNNIFVFRASNGKFLAPRFDLRGLLHLSDFNSAKITVAELIIKRVVSDFVYDTDGSTVTELTPEIALSTTIRNDSESNSFTQTLTYSYLTSVVGTWSNTFGGSLTVKTTFATKIPFLVEGKIEASATVNYSHTEGGSVTTTKTVTSTSVLAVPALKKGVATILIKKAIIDVPFTYTETTWYQSGKFEDVTKKGIYRNVESYRVDVRVTNDKGHKGWESI